MNFNKDKHDLYLRFLNNIYSNYYELTNSSFYQYYQKIIQEEISLIKKLSYGDNRIITFFSIYYYLLWNGYLSLTKNFEFTEDNTEIKTMIGSSIYFGRGVCRNISAHFTELLKAVNPQIEVYTIGTHLAARKEKIMPQLNNVKYNINLCGINHAETLVGIDNLWLFDPTNFRIKKLKYSEDHKLTSLYDTRTSLLLDNFYLNGFPMNIIENLENYNEYLSKTEQIYLSNIKLNSIRNEGIIRCNEGKYYIDEFRENTQNLFKKIRKEKRRVLKNK